MWDIRYEDSFIELKKRLTTTRVLILPELNELFVIYRDALLMGLGGVLMQDGKFVCNTLNFPHVSLKYLS